MSWVKTEKTNYQNIATAIRTKAGSADTFLPSEMAAAIAAIPAGSLSDLTFTNMTPVSGTGTASSADPISKSAAVYYGDNPKPKYMLFFLSACYESNGLPAQAINAFILFDSEANVIASYTSDNDYPMSVSAYTGGYLVSGSFFCARNANYAYTFSICSMD